MSPTPVSAPSTRAVRSRNSVSHAAAWVALLGAPLLALPAAADENLFGYVAGAEPTPKGHNETYFWLTNRYDKGAGRYSAQDLKLEYEHGITDNLAGAVYLTGQSINTSGIRIDGYVPADAKYGMRFSGIEGSLKYAFLRPALDDIGLAGYLSASYSTLDPHSGQDKDKYSLEGKLLAQKYLMDGQLVLAGNLGLEATYAVRKPIAGLPVNDATGEPLEWTLDPEMEIGVMAAAGISYRFAPNWYIGFEALYDTEFETAVGQERWSLQAGPTLHYGSKNWWATLTWLPQLRGGGEKFGPASFDGVSYPGQNDPNLHLIEKTKYEVRLKVGINF
ncbi:MAG TPA: DUF6662 family protein [Burkholderiales bacterium]|nr:DUF6662 family protein [Burkholderiales bacterium]